MKSGHRSAGMYCFCGEMTVIGFIRNMRGLAAAVCAAAFLLASQVIFSSAIASRMEASDLLFGSLDQSICSSQTDHSGEPDSDQSALHKKICDICFFAAQSSLPTANLLSHVARPTPLTTIVEPQSAGILLRQIHEPRLTRGPPLNA
jgi:hypothetical protein